MENRLYQITLKGITAGIIVAPDGVVVETAPVLRKFIGVRLDKLRGWVAKNGGRMQRVGGDAGQ